MTNGEPNKPSKRLLAEVLGVLGGPHRFPAPLTGWQRIVRPGPSEAGLNAGCGRSR
jgi:hypothetical protein